MFIYEIYEEISCKYLTFWLIFVNFVQVYKLLARKLWKVPLYILDKQNALSTQDLAKFRLSCNYLARSAAAQFRQENPLEQRSSSASVFPGRGFWVNFCKKCGECASFCKKFADCGECGEKNYFTAKFTAFLTKIHRICFPTFPESDKNSQEIAKKYVTVGTVE